MYVIVHDNLHDINIPVVTYLDLLNFIFVIRIFVHESEHATM